MEDFQKAQGEAKAKLWLAQHMLQETYPAVNDPRVLMNISENIFLAAQYVMTSLLQFERAFKRVPPLSQNVEINIKVLEKHATRLGVDVKLVKLLHELHELLEKHKASAVEFSRDGKMVVCSDDFKVRQVGVSDVRVYLEDAKELYRRVVEITAAKEALFDDD